MIVLHLRYYFVLNFIRNGSCISDMSSQCKTSKINYGRLLRKLNTEDDTVKFLQVNYI